VWTATEPGPDEVGIARIDCAGPDFCAGVGAVPGAVTQPLLAVGDGTHWTRDTSTPLVPAPSGEHLADVSCASRASCVAVGHARFQGHGQSLALRWDGTRWTHLTHPGPVGDGVVLTDVECPDPTWCVVVGYRGPAGDPARPGPLPPSPDPASAVLRTLTVPPSGDAVWVDVPVPDEDTGLVRLSCASPEDCVAEGADHTFIGGRSGWRTGPVIPGAVLDLSCLSASRCLAVADAEGVSFLERWDGTAWTAIALRTTTGQSITSPLSVECIAGRSCFVNATVWTGWSASPGFVRTDGVTSTVAALGVPAPSGLSCAADDDCVALSGAPGTSAARARHFDGTSWRELAAPLFPVPAPPSPIALYGTVALSCVPGWCMHVGPTPPLGGEPEPPAPFAETLAHHPAGRDTTG
jgi:hypothetical protein